MTQIADGVEELDPPRSDPRYAVTVGRAPLKPELRLPAGWFHHMPGPVFGQIRALPADADLTMHGAAEPLGQRIVVYGEVRDSDGRPVRDALVEIWQANAAGGYVDSLDISGRPLDPNFIGAGHCVTDDQGRYRFTTIRPGAYPMVYAPNASGWRAAHIHFSLCGPGICSRLITQMYFEADPLLATDWMWQGIPDPRGRERLLARYSPEETITQFLGPRRTAPTLDGSGRIVSPPPASADVPDFNPSALAYRFDIVLRGGRATPFEHRS